MSYTMMVITLNPTSSVSLEFWKGLKNIRYTIQKSIYSKQSLAVTRQSPGNHQAVTRQLPGSQKAVVRKRSHWAVVKLMIEYGSKSISSLFLLDVFQLNVQIMPFWQDVSVEFWIFDICNYVFSSWPSFEIWGTFKVSFIRMPFNSKEIILSELDFFQIWF